MPNMGCRNLGSDGNWEWCRKNGKNTTCRKWWCRKIQLGKNVNRWQTVISGGKDSGIRAEKNCFLLALSDGAEHRPYKRLWLLLCFVPSDNIGEGKSDFFSALILLCAVLEADQWPKNLFLFIKIFLAVVCWRYWKKRKRVHHFLPFDSAQGKLLSYGGDLKVFYVVLLY